MYNAGNSVLNLFENKVKIHIVNLAHFCETQGFTICV